MHFNHCLSTYLLCFVSLSTASPREFAPQLEDALVARTQTSTPPTTTCTTFGGKSKKTITYTETADCTNVSTSTKTKTTITRPVTTSTVYDTSTATDPTKTDTATSTVFETTISSYTTTETSTSTETEYDTTTFTSSYPTSAPTKRDALVPVERDLEARAKTKTTKTTPRPTPTSGVVCVVSECESSTQIITTTVTKKFKTSTSYTTSHFTTTVTPRAATTVSETSTFITTSTFTASTVTTITTTTTETTTYTPTPTFYILSSSNPDLPDGTQLRRSGEIVIFDPNNDGDLFALDPTTAYVFQVSDQNIANVDRGSTLSAFFFDTPDSVGPYGYPPCTCSINFDTFALECTCEGNKVFQIEDQNGILLIGAKLQDNFAPETPIVSIVDQN